MYDDRAIANFMLDEAERQYGCLTHLSLQKLLFFAHAWHLARYDSPLVKGLFQAWQFGPVLRSVYDSFRAFGKKPITGRAKALDLLTGQYVVCTADLDEPVTQLLKAVVASGATMSAWELSELTHVKGSPWDQVWLRAKSEINVGMRVPNDLIRNYFLTSDFPLPRG